MAINQTVQVRLEPNFRSKVEARAIERGFTKPKGESNLPAYFRFLAMEDLTTKLDGNVKLYEKSGKDYKNE